MVKQNPTTKTSALKSAGYSQNQGEITTDKVGAILRAILKLPGVKTALIWLASKVVEKGMDKVFLIKNKSKKGETKMEKGFFSKAAQDELIKKVKELLKNQKVALVLLIIMAIKAIFLYVDDQVVESKLPQELTDKCQAFFDAILVTKDAEKAMELGIDLVGIVWPLIFKKSTPTI
jgi:hypothetical protein